MRASTIRTNNVTRIERVGLECGSLAAVTEAVEAVIAEFLVAGTVLRATKIAILRPFHLFPRQRFVLHDLKVLRYHSRRKG